MDPDSILSKPYLASPTVSLQLMGSTFQESLEWAHLIESEEVRGQLGSVRDTLDGIRIRVVISGDPHSSPCPMAHLCNKDDRSTDWANAI